MKNKHVNKYYVFLYNLKINVIPYMILNLNLFKTYTVKKPPFQRKQMKPKAWKPWSAAQRSITVRKSR